MPAKGVAWCEAMLIAPINGFREIQPYDFLAQILPATGEHWMIMFRRKGSDYFEHESFSSIDSLAQRVMVLDAQGSEVWHAMGSFHNAHNSPMPNTKVSWGRKAENVAYLGAFWLDIDVDSEKHKHYRTVEEAASALDDFCVQSGLRPNWIVHSGVGLHAYWVLDADVLRDRWQTSARKFKQAIKAAGLMADPTRTADVCSVLRPVGTFSKKRNCPVVGQWVRYGNISLEEFDSCVEKIINANLAQQVSAFEPSRITPEHTDEMDHARWFDAQDIETKIGDVKSMLDQLPISYAEKYDTWLMIGAAVRGIPEIQEDVLFSLWAYWSQQIGTWDDKQTIEHRAKWNGLNRSSVGSLIYHAKQNGWNKTQQLAVARSSEQKPAFQGRCATIADARDMIAKNYAYARLENRFICRDGAVLSVEAFERSLARLMPLDNSGKPLSAVHVATKNGAAALVDVTGYAPGQDFIYEDKGTGQRMANRYQRHTVEELEPTDLEVRALRAFRKHLVSDDPDTERMLHYFDQAIAYLVQHPKERVPKVFLLIGERQGSGKSTYILGFTRALFGWQNVGKVTNSEIRSNFNEWMTDKQIVCLEEIWMTNRKDSRDLVNSLKDNITDEIARIHPKGGKGFQMTNPATYFASSNHLDAVDLADGERRWAIAQTKAGPLDERFAKWLHGWLQPSGRGSGVLLYTYRRKSIEGFNPYGPVPFSQAKIDVIDLSQTDVERIMYEAWIASIGPFAADITTLEDVSQFINLKIGLNVSHKTVLLALQSERMKSVPARAKTERDGDVLVKRIWIVRNHQAYASLGPAGLYSAYENTQKLKPHLRLVP
jgi:hypothetical protein